MAGKFPMKFAAKKAMPFEKSPMDKEPKGMKEGSKREEAYDAKQMKAGAKKAAPAKKPFKKG